MYMSLEEAREEVWKRWNDADLRRRVLEYVGELPEGLGLEPRAVIARHLATPNLEFIKFIEEAGNSCLNPICLEFSGDKFVSMNPDKLLLGKAVFYHGKGKKNGDKTSTKHLIDLHSEDGNAIHSIKTIWGEKLVTFHHRILKAELSKVDASAKVLSL